MKKVLSLLFALFLCLSVVSVSAAETSYNVIWNTHNDLREMSAKISDNGNVVWEREESNGNHQIYLYDGENDPITINDSTQTYNSYPEINNSGDVVWTGQTSSRVESVFLYDIQPVRIICA